MAVAMIERPSWSYRPARGHAPHGCALSDRAQPDQGPAQEIVGEMTRLLRNTHSSILLGGSVLSTITWTGAHLLLGAARMGGRLAHVADAWTYIAAAYLLVWIIIVILLGL